MVKENMIVLGLKLLIICYVLSDLANFIGELIDTIITTKNKPLQVIKTLLVYLLSCSKCFSMWFSLAASGSLFLACVIAIIIHYLKKIEYKFFSDTSI
jgi:hypothetical protein